MARDLRLSRFDLKYDVMHLPREAREQTIRLLGEEVAPRVRELIADLPDPVQRATIAADDRDEEPAHV